MKTAPRAFGFGTPLLLLLTACPGAPTVPYSCADTEVLVMEAGEWRCAAPPPLLPRVFPEKCSETPDTVLTSSGTWLTCEPATRGIDQSMQVAKALLVELEANVTTLGVSRTSSLGSYRGVTTAVSSGEIRASGAETGLDAAAARCEMQWADSHLCSMLELYQSVARGQIDKSTRIPKAWIFFPAGNAGAGAVQPQDGIADTCAGYSYGRDDRGWTGLAVEWTTLPTGYVGFKFHGGANAPCSSMLPLACCGGTP